MYGIRYCTEERDREGGREGRGGNLSLKAYRTNTDRAVLCCSGGSCHWLVPLIDSCVSKRGEEEIERNGWMDGWMWGGIWDSFAKKYHTNV